MARTFHRRSQLEAMSELNVTPLIDLAFALLIIFMITAPLLEQSIDLDLPTETVRPQTASVQTVQEISIDATGQYYWGNEAMSRDRIDELLELVALDAEPPVIQIRADATLPYQQIVDAIDLVKKHKLNKLSLETRGR